MTRGSCRVLLCQPTMLSLRPEHVCACSVSSVRIGCQDQESFQCCDFGLFFTSSRLFSFFSFFLRFIWNRICLLFCVSPGIHQKKKSEISFNQTNKQTFQKTKKKKQILLRREILRASRWQRHHRRQRAFPLPRGLVPTRLHRKGRNW